MPDRILRDELWLSDRFLDLPTDIARLAFLRFVSLADDFGNFEGGIRRLARVLHACTQSKTDEAISQTLDALMAADLIRCYQAEGRDLIHIPRFRSKRWYFARKVPASPWCDASTPLGKEERAQKQTPPQEVDTTLSQRCSHVAEGVGVGVGVGVGEKKKRNTSRAPRTSPVPAGLESVSEQVRNDWFALRKSKRAAVTSTAISGIAREAEKAGCSLEDALAMSCARGWTGFKAEWIADAGKTPPSVTAPSAAAEKTAAYLREQAAHAAAAKSAAEKRRELRETR